MFKAVDDIDKLVLIEIGPRFTLTPIKAFEGSLSGEALWQNGEYIAPTKLRGKKYDSFQKKRDEKEFAKVYKKTILE
jgi:ribosome biogenesis protein BRX1